MKEQAIELLWKIIPLMYCFRGSGMLVNYYEHDIALENAIKCLELTNHPLFEHASKLTVNDFWTEDQLTHY